MCVKHCPATNTDVLHCKTNTRVTSCADPTPGVAWTKDWVNRTEVYPTVPLYGRLCMP